MKANTVVSIIAAIIAVVFAIMWFSTNSQKTTLSNQNDSLRTQLANTQKTVTDMQSDFDTISNGLGINGPNVVESPTSEFKKSELVRKINDIKHQIENDKKTIAKLTKSSQQSESLKKLVNQLKSSLAEKEKALADLTTKLKQANETITTERALSKEEIAKRDQDILNKQMLIDSQIKDLNTIFYVVGKRKDLVNLKLVSQKGGLLGIGSVTTVNKNMDLDKFQTVNLQTTNEISFPMTKKGYSILTTQAPSSFQVTKSGSSYVLNVTNLEQFRKNKVLIIEIK